MKQPELFGNRVEFAGTGWIHCKTRAILGEPIDYGDCVNQQILCAVCGRILGEFSSRKDLAVGE